MVTFKARVVDDNALPVAGAIVDLSITGPETHSLTATSDANGIAEATWQTKAPNKNGKGGTKLGTYTASVSNVTAENYSWDGVMISNTFEIQ